MYSRFHRMIKPELRCYLYSMCLRHTIFYTHTHDTPTYEAQVSRLPSITYEFSFSFFLCVFFYSNSHDVLLLWNSGQGVRPHTWRFTSTEKKNNFPDIGYKLSGRLDVKCKIAAVRMENDDFPKPCTSFSTWKERFAVRYTHSSKAAHTTGLCPLFVIFFYFHMPPHMLHGIINVVNGAIRRCDHFDFVHAEKPYTHTFTVQKDCIRTTFNLYLVHRHIFFSSSFSSCLVYFPVFSILHDGSTQLTIFYWKTCAKMGRKKSFKIFINNFQLVADYSRLILLFWAWYGLVCS